MWSKAVSSVITGLMKTFNATDNILPGYFPGVLYRLLCAEGIASDVLLENTEFTPETFDSDTVRFNFQQHRIFINNAIRATDNPNLGFWFGQQLNVTVLGLVGYAALSSATVEDALETIVRFFYLRAPLLQLSLQEGQQDWGLCVQENLDLQDIRYFMHSAALAGSHKLLQYYLGTAPLQVKVHMALPRPDCFDEATEQSLPFNCEFGQPQTCLWFPADILSIPMTMADPQTASSTSELCQKQLDNAGIKQGIVAKVRDFLARNYEQSPGLQETAEHCHLSQRTLRRELTRSGTHFQAIFDQVRKDIAMEMLATPGISITTIAYKLGFKELSNFRRAFKKWTGSTPSDFRKSRLGA